jgi:hypothetical protein
MTRPGDDVGDSGGQSGLDEQLDQRDGRHRGDLARLDDEGVSGGQGRGDLPTGLEQRVVPGRDHRADADGLVDDDAVDVGRAGVHDPARALGRDEVGEVPEGVGDAVDVDAPFLDGLAGVTALQQPELLAVAHEQVGDAAQQRGPLGGGRPRPLPLVEGAPGGGDRQIGVLLVTLRDHGERQGVRGVEDLARGAGDGRTPFPSRVDGAARLEFVAFRHDRFRLPFLISAPVSQMCH